MTSKDAWEHIPGEAPDPIFALDQKAKQAKGETVNLIIGAYRDPEGNPYPLKVIREAEKIVMEKAYNYEYLPISGFYPFINEAVKLLFGDSIPLENVVGFQSIGGTGALSLAARFLSFAYDRETTHVYLSNPTWPNHHGIFNLAGYKNIKYYNYYNPESVSFDFESMKKDVLAAPEKSIFVLHACAHNPTGVDPTHEQWKELADIFIKKNHQVLFDTAYQGYASGDLDADAFAPRYFAKAGIQFLIAQSFSKNMGLYSERVGCLSVIIKDPSHAPRIRSVLELIARAVQSNPPSYGVRLVYHILSDPIMNKKWKEEVKGMADRIKSMRKLLFNELVNLKTPPPASRTNWDHVTTQIGMFSFLGITKEQCQYLQDHNVFVTLTGRANMAGLTEKSAKILAKTIDEACRAHPSAPKS